MADDLYILDCGVIRKLTPEEIAKYKHPENPERHPQPTIDERVTVLEQNMADIQTAYQEGVNNA